MLKIIEKIAGAIFPPLIAILVGFAYYIVGILIIN